MMKSRQRFAAWMTRPEENGEEPKALPDTGRSIQNGCGNLGENGGKNRRKGSFRMCRNIYLAARQASGLTQERAAERIPVSVRSLADYEAGVRRPTTETVVRMVEIYDAQYLAYQHLRETSDLAQRLIPDVMGAELPEATLQLLDAIYDFADAHFDRRLIAIARDGKIDDKERAEFDRIAARLEDIVRCALAVNYGANLAQE